MGENCKRAKLIGNKQIHSLTHKHTDTQQITKTACNTSKVAQAAVIKQQTLKC